MTDDKFFQEENMDDTQEVEKVKVGEKEFTPDELNKLVGLGEIAMEAEEKYNRPISKFWPEYTKTNQELEKTKLELEELRKAATQPKAELTEVEDVEKKVKEELGKYGYKTAEEIEHRAREIANEVISGYRLLEDVDSIISKNIEDGYPQDTREGLLEYMQEKNINDPEVAYKIKFEKELDSIKEKKLASLKPQGLVTEKTSTAGGKQPQPIKITKDNLQNVLGEYLRRE